MSSVLLFLLLHDKNSIIWWWWSQISQTLYKTHFQVDMMLSQKLQEEVLKLETILEPSMKIFWIRDTSAQPTIQMSKLIKPSRFIREIKFKASLQWTVSYSWWFPKYRSLNFQRNKPLNKYICIFVNWLLISTGRYLEDSLRSCKSSHLQPIKEYLRKKRKQK